MTFYSASELLDVVEDPDEGDSLSVIDVFDVVGGQATLTETGSILFTPDPDFVGDAHFTYTVSDGRGGTVNVTATIHVDEMNDAPVAIADTAEMTAGAAAVISPLANDTDVDPDDSIALNHAEVVSVTGAPGVSAALLSEFLTITDTTIEIPPTRLFEGLALNQSATVTLGYGIIDTRGGQAGSTVTLTVTGAAPVDYVVHTGTAGADTLTGSAATDQLDGLGGADTLSGLAGNDNLYGGAESDTLDGGADDDRIDGGDGNDVLTGGAGNDQFVATGQFGHDVITDAGDPGTFDWISLSSEYLPSDIILQRDTIDPTAMVLQAGDNSITVTGQWGSGDAPIDAVAFADGTVWNADALRGRYLDQNSTTGADTIDGFDGDDVIDARAGDDIVNAAGGDDEVSGADGDDDIGGGAGYDALYGDAGDDTLRGGADDDYLSGGSGNDTYAFTAGDGADLIDDAAGEANIISLTSIDAEDVLVYRSGDDDEDLVLDFGDDGSITVLGQWLAGDAVIDEIRFDDGTVWSRADIEQIYLAQASTPGYDNIIGFEGDDVINGGRGNDSIEGRGGDDRIYGSVDDEFIDAGAGNDLISSGGGWDLIVGGDGIDRFDFSTSTYPDRPYVYDFDAAHEKVILAITPGQASFSDLSITYEFGTAVINLANGGTITLGDTADGALTAGNFLFINPGDPLPVNATPHAAAADETFTGSEDTPVSGTLAAGSDANGDDLTFHLAPGSAIGGSVEIDAETGAFTFTPDPDFNGEAAFAYVLNDGELDSAPKTVTLVFDPVNDGAPVVDAAAEAATGNEDALVTGVLLTGSDVDGDALTFHAVASSSIGGEVEIDPETGAYSFTPAAEFSGEASFRYVLNDGTADSAEKTVTITIVAVNDAPVAAAAPQQASADQDTVVTGSLLAGSDIEGDALTFTLVTDWYGEAVGGTVTIDPVTGAYAFTPEAGFTGDAYFSYAVNDGQLDSAPKTVTITYIANANSAPDDAALSGGSIAENSANGSVAGTVTGHDPDAGATLAYTLLNDAGGRFAIDAMTGQVTVANGSLLDYDSAASHTITVRVTDQGGLVFDKAFTITLTNVAGSTLTGTAGANTLTGTGEDDTLNGLGGNDTLNGLGGPDRMTGGTGNDIYYVDDAGDLVIENAAEGTDTVRASIVAYALASNVENLVGLAASGQTLTGNALANAITGAGGSDTLDGGAGNDTLVGGAGADTLLGGDGNDSLTGGADADTLAGGLGNDTYYVDDATDMVVENAGEGTDTVRTALSAYTLTDNVETLIGTAASGQTLGGNALANSITGTGAGDTLLGDGGNDTLNGGAGDDTLDGGDGNDALTGGIGADQMSGGLGNDTYTADDAGDVVIETAGGGTDTVKTALAAYTLGDEVERLTGTAATGQVLTGNALANIITGGAGNDTLNGGDGNDTLSGGAGADAMTGGLANDTYTVDDAGDVVIENAGEGTDTVRTSLTSYTLGAEIENLVGTATTGQTLIGNDLGNGITGAAGDDTLIGGLGNDSLSGGAGSDSLTGGDGNDTMNGGLGADTMTGGLGNDTYYVDDSGDFVFELLGEGTDAVRTTLADYALDATLENLVGTSATGQTLTGNGGANSIAGGAGNDTLSGGDGNDSMNGGLGNDTLDGGDGNDSMNGGGGTDTLRGGAGNDTLNGSTENDVLDGGAGNDRLTGGGGSDTFVFHAGFGKDVVTDFIAGSGDVIEFHDGVFADAAAALAAATASGNNTIVTVDANTTITLQNVHHSDLSVNDFHIV